VNARAQEQSSDGSPNGHPTQRWFSISEACSFLGVDQSTLRRWSDDGRVPVFLTPGGHRRYAEEDLRALVVGNPRKNSKIRVSRQELTNRTLSAYEDDFLKTARQQKWFRAFGATSQEEHRRIGRRLVDLAIRYAATAGHQSDRAQFLDEGRQIGEHYGRSSAKAELSTSETIEVFLYFRYPVVKALLEVIEKEGLPARRASRLFIGIDDFIDEVLISMMRAHDQARGATVDRPSSVRQS
jgi:excisionase family DNA binding protein